MVAHATFLSLFLLATETHPRLPVCPRAPQTRSSNNVRLQKLDGSVVEMSQAQASRILGTPSGEASKMGQFTAWVQSNIPSGFENFFPKGMKPKGSSSEDKESKSDTKGSEEKKSSGGGGGGGPNWTGGPGGGRGGKKKDDKSGPFPDLPPANIQGLMVIGTAGLLYTLLSGQGSNSRSISWQDFKHQYLMRGLVERLVVVNKNTVRA